VVQILVQAILGVRHIVIQSILNVLAEQCKELIASVLSFVSVVLKPTRLLETYASFVLCISYLISESALSLTVGVTVAVRVHFG